MKRLRNTEDQSKINEKDKDNQSGVKSIGYTIKESKKSQEAKNMLNKLSKQEKLIDYKKLNFKGGNNVSYDFSNFRPLREIIRTNHYSEITIPGAERDQIGFNRLLSQLRIYNPRNSEYRKSKESLLINEKHFYDGRKMIIDALKSKYFH